MNLTAEGFRPVSFDCQNFDNEQDARADFDRIDADFLFNDGFRGHQIVKIYLSAHTFDDDGEIHSTVIAEKSVTVDDQVS